MHTQCEYSAHSSRGNCADYSHDRYACLPHKSSVDKAWFKARKREVKASDEKLALAIGRDRTTVTKVINGDVRFDLTFVEGFARVLEVSSSEILRRVGLSLPDQPEVEAGPRRDRPEQPSARTADSGETAPVVRLDMSYSMGPGTDLDDSYIDGEAFQFDLGFLRSMTVTPPDRIRIVDGIGDSMQPTLHDRDLLFVDVNQRDLNAQDRIWAIWLFGLGAVKRLRALSADAVLVMSDNPDVPDQEVSRKDILIHGRVVGSIKRH